MKSYTILATIWIDLEEGETDQFIDGLNDAIIDFVESKNRVMCSSISLEEINDEQEN